MIPVVEIMFLCPPPYKFKKYPYKHILYDDSHSEHQVPVTVTVMLCINLVLLAVLEVR
jgi:hypothetical protein